MVFLFEDLEVYKKSIAFAEEIGCITDGFEKGNYYLVDQLNRAALSIAANIAEGNGRYHDADRRNFFRISRGSTFECVPILEICSRKKLISLEKKLSLRNDLDEICKMLSGLIRC